MDKYIGKNYTILNGTLLSCKPEGNRLFIPAEVEGHKILRIGNGCSGGAETEYIEIGEGVRELGSKSFEDCEKLKLLVLPESMEDFGSYTRCILVGKGTELRVKRRISFAEEKQIREGGFPVRWDALLLGNWIEQLEPMVPVYKAFFLGAARWRRDPAVLRPEMGGLYRQKYRDWDLHAEQILFQGMREPVVICADLDGAGLRRELLRVLLKEKPQKLMDTESDLNSDRMLQKGMQPTLHPVILTRLYDKDVVRDEQGVSAVFTLSLGTVFFPEYTEVMYDGKRYYLLSEIYLSSDEQYPFIRMDYPEEVYDEHGERVRGDICKLVAAKYKLLTMLS